LAWAAISMTSFLPRAPSSRGGRGAGVRAVADYLCGPEETLKLTEHTQPAILTVSTATARVLTGALAAHGLAPAMAAGHSLGEYSAHVAAGP